MSGAERRREERVPFESRVRKKTNKKTRTPTRRVGRVRSRVVVAPRANRRQLELILRNQQKSAAEADQGFGGHLTGITYYSSLAVFAMMGERKARFCRRVRR